MALLMRCSELGTLATHRENAVLPNYMCNFYRCIYYKKVACPNATEPPLHVTGGAALMQRDHHCM